MKPMILHDLSDVDHGEMALRDYFKLGGDEAFARQRRITPASFCMAATCRLLATNEEPWSCLGYMYLFESLTPVLTKRAQAILAAKNFPSGAQRFIDFHAKEDVGHSTLMADLVDRVVKEYPEARSAIEYGFDCFASVYPLPIWEAPGRRDSAGTFDSGRAAQAAECAAPKQHDFAPHAGLGSPAGSRTRRAPGAM